MSVPRTASSIRAYATAVAHPSRRAKLPTPPPVLAATKESSKRVRRDPKRPYPQRKAHIYDQYTRLITQPRPIRPDSASKSSQPATEPPAQQPVPSIVLISYENFSVSAFTKVRGEIVAAVAKLQAARDRANPEGAERLSAQFQVLRPTLFLPVVKKASGKKEAKKLEKIMKGPIAAVVMHGALDPPLLTAVLRVLDKAAPPRPAEASKPAAKAEDDFEKKAKPTPVPKMEVVGAYVDGKVFGKDRVKEIAKLPQLHELRAQIIGLVGAPASKLASVLGAAAGGRLALTLEGWKWGLEEGSSPPSS